MALRTSGNATVLAATEVTPADWRDLADVLEVYGGPGALLRQTPTHEAEGQLLGFLRSALDPGRVKYWLTRLERLESEMPSVHLLTADDKRYPANLRAAYGRPPFLFVDGSLDDRDDRSIAIVGSRDVTSDALEAAEWLASLAALHGLTVVSGLARGIDAAAHRGALRAGGRTIAVVAAGIDRPVSVESDGSLCKAILRQGSLVSQFRPGSPPTRSSFVLRNSVISGLSLASIIVDAGERSGARSEADFALQQGRRVLLWRPSFERMPWARLYAQQELVSMVDSPSEVLAIVDDAAREVPADE
jgi:DNA processing protein